MELGPISGDPLELWMASDFRRGRTSFSVGFASRRATGFDGRILLAVDTTEAVLGVQDARWAGDSISLTQLLWSCWSRASLSLIKTK